MVLAGLLAAIIFFYASIQGQKTFFVTALSSPLQTGEPINAASLRRVEVNMPPQALARMVSVAEAQNFDGWIATGPMEAGDLLSKSDLRAPGAPDRLRAMSIPRPQSHVVAGAITVGDRVDIVTEKTPQRFVAQNLEVLAVGSPGTAGAIGGGGLEDYTITVAVLPSQAIAIATELLDPAFDVVRSTGARPLIEYGIQIDDSVPPTITRDGIIAAPGTTTPGTTGAGR